MREGAGVKEEGDEGLRFFRVVTLEVLERVRLFVAGGIGRSGSDGSTEGLDEFEDKGEVRNANAESAMFRFEDFNYFALTFRDNGDRAREEVLVEIASGWIKLDVSFSHCLVGYSNGYGFALAITFELEEFGDGLRVGGVGGNAIAGFGGIDDEITLLKFFYSSMDDGWFVSG